MSVTSPHYGECSYTISVVRIRH